MDDEEAILGVYCVAAPVLSAKGECLAAISISAPKNRVTEQTTALFTRLVQETAQDISTSLTEP